MAAELITSNTGSAIDTNPVNNNEYKAWGEALTIPAEGPDYWLSSFMVSLRRYGSFSGNVWAEVYATTGTVGSDARPTGSPLAVSASFNSTSISTSTYQWVTMEFDETFKLEAGASYVLVVTSDNGTASDYVSTRLTDETAHPGNAAVLYGSRWASSSVDIQFQLYGTPDEGAEDQTLSPIGVPSGAQIGSLTVVLGNVNIGVFGIPSTVQFGTLTLVPDAVTPPLSGIPSSVQMGTPALVPGNVNLILAGVPPGLAIGVPELIMEFTPLQILLGLLEMPLILTESENASDGTKSSGVILLALTEKRPTVAMVETGRVVSLLEMPLALEQEVLDTELEVT